MARTRRALERKGLVGRLTLIVDEDIPRALLDAVRAEAHAQGKTIRQVTVALFERFLLESPQWRAFLREESQRPGAQARRGRPRLETLRKTP